ncbi:MAG: mycothiol synthase [Actinomycetota bacterium]
MPSPSIPDSLATLIEHARDADGQSPFSDGALVKLRIGGKRLLAFDQAAAIYSASEAELVVEPSERGKGIGTRLFEAVLERGDPGMKIWAHGDHPAARALAASHGFEPVRRLLQLRAPVSAGLSFAASSAGRSSAAWSAGFRPGVDEDDWIALNARAFASHPEQGSVTRADLDELTAEPWFDPDDFLLLRDNHLLVGSCWLKIDGPVGEFYVVGVDPERQGGGLGRVLMDAGFARLAARGIRIAALYVESDNVPALALYHSLGFTEHSVDIQYARA